MQSRKSSFALSIVKGAAVMFVLLSAFGTFAGAATTYTENTIYSFGSNFPDGEYPLRDGLVMDTAGNLYGITEKAFCSLNELCIGTVFELSPNGSGGWTETVLHVFDPQSTVNPNDGADPVGKIAIDSKGNLYGTCFWGGPNFGVGTGNYSNGSGIVWELSPPAVNGNPWTETILWSFGAFGSGDGFFPYGGVTLASSSATVLYGTTECGGSGPATFETCEYGSGTVFELTYVKATKTVPAHWKETILHNFVATDGAAPYGGLLLSAGSLYGYTHNGGTGYNPPDNIGGGVVYELKPSGTASTLNVLYNFGATTTDAAEPLYGAPVMDTAKNLYGTSLGGGTYGGGAVWELAYSAVTKTYTTEQVIYSFGANPDYIRPNWGLVYSKGSLFGATGGEDGPSQGGSVFELTYKKPTKTSAGGWQETDLYDFSVASYSWGPGFNQLIEDSKGNFYGMVPGYGYGVVPNGAVFELSPSTE